jgi:cytoskeletal protein CcmA (bactofilin family)
MWKTRPGKAEQLTAFIDEGSEIEGKYTFSGTLMLNGKFRGEIASTDTLVISEKAVVHGTARAGVIMVSGQVTGNLFATQRVELHGAARVFGDIETPVLVVREGVLFDGHCRMTAPVAPSTTPGQRDLAIVR